jgi:hypothetical protein
MHHDVPPADRFVGDAARVPTVDTPGTTTAGRALRRSCRPPRLNVQGVCTDEHPLSVEAGQLWEEA